MGVTVLALDVGGTNIKWGIVERGEIIHRSLTPSRGGEAPLADAITAIYRQVNAHVPVEAYAIACAGAIDSKRGVVIKSPNLSIDKPTPLAQLLADRIGRPPAVLVNDLVGACAGEAAPDQTLALMFVGTGIGAKVALEGKVQAGANGFGAEVGHLTFKEGGRLCGCGRRGCAEAYAGWAGVRRAYREAGRQPPPAPAMVRAQAEAGDPLAMRVLEEALQAVVFACAALVSATDPGVLRLGGGMTAALGKEQFIAEVAERLPSYCWVGDRTVVEPARLGGDAALLGLAYLAGRAH